MTSSRTASSRRTSSATTCTAYSIRLRRVIRAGSRSTICWSKRRSVSASHRPAGVRCRTAAGSTPFGITSICASGSPSAWAIWRWRSRETATYVAPGIGVVSRFHGRPRWRAGRYCGLVQARSWHHATMRSAGCEAARPCRAAVSARFLWRERTLWARQTSTPLSARPSASSSCALSASNAGPARPSSSCWVTAMTRRCRESASGTRWSRTPPPGAWARPAMRRTSNPSAARRRA